MLFFTAFLHFKQRVYVCVCESICVCMWGDGRHVIVVTLPFVSHGQQSVSRRVLAPTNMQCILLYFVALLLVVHVAGHPGSFFNVVLR